MKLLNSLFNNNEEQEKNVKYQPVNIDDVENIIELIKVAQKNVAMFSICFQLDIGEFSVDSDSLEDIKILKKTKNENERIQIQYSDVLLEHNVVIQLENIVGVFFDLQYFVFPIEVEDGEE